MNVTFEGSLVSSEMKRELQSEFLLFHNNLPSCINQDGSRSYASVGTNSCSVRDSRTCSLLSLFNSHSSRATCCHMTSRATPPQTLAPTSSSTASLAPRTNTESSSSSSNGNFLLGFCLGAGHVVKLPLVYIQRSDMLEDISKSKICVQICTVLEKNN